MTGHHQDALFIGHRLMEIFLQATEVRHDDTSYTPIILPLSFQSVRLVTAAGLAGEIDLSGGKHDGVRDVRVGQTTPV